MQLQASDPPARQGFSDGQREQCQRVAACVDAQTLAHIRGQGRIGGAQQSVGAAAAQRRQLVHPETAARESVIEVHPDRDIHAQVDPALATGRMARSHRAGRIQPLQVVDDQ
ncbi:hypothetical protein AB0M12_23760 [Nocardia vinacea]|uniref:hypothetical protein n=1 Tax=Nocardia vinacea TaxID=96468 RepID=UPI0034202848